MHLKGLYRTGVLNVVYRFFRDDVSVRFEDILFTQETALSVGIGLFFYFYGARYCKEAAKFGDLAIGYLGYAAIALGFCVGAITVALTLPDRDFMKKLATRERRGKPGDALSGLIFVFCWTAIVHWLSIVAIIVLLILMGHSEAPFFASPTFGRRIIASLIGSLCSYALMQFLITVLTLWQAGASFIRDLKKSAQESHHGSSPQNGQ